MSGPPMEIGPSTRGRSFETTVLQSGLNALRQRAEIGDALQFVVWQLDMEMVFQSSQKIERLQAIYTQSLKEVVIGRESFARNLEVRRGEVKNLVECLVLGAHSHFIIIS